MKMILFSLLLLGTALPARAENLTLSAVIQESQQNSPEVQKAQSAAREATWKRRESYSGFLPTLTADATYLTSKRYMLINMPFNGNTVIFPTIVPTADYTVTARWPIFDGFASTNIWRSSSRLESAAERLRDWTEYSTGLQVTLLFYKSLAAQSLKEVAHQNLSTLQEHQRDVNALKRAGISTKYDVLRSETQISEAESEILSADDNVELASYKLGEVLGKEKEDRPLSGKLPVLNAELIKNLKIDDISHRADLEALSDRNDALEYIDRAENRYWVPRVSLFGQYQYYNNLDNTIWDNDHFRDAYQFGVNLSWNIFDGLKSISRSRQAAEQSSQFQKTLLEARLKAKQDFEFWRRKFLYFCAVYKARDNDIARSTEAVRLASLGRKAGTRTTTDLLDAELDLFRARSELVTAQIGATEALIQLELASGEKLYDFN